MKTTASLSKTTFTLVMIISLITVLAAGAFAGKQDRQVANFSEIEISSTIKVVLTQGSTEKLTLEGDDEMLERVISEVRENTLIIKLKDGTYKKTSQKVTAHLNFKNLSRIDLSGAVTLTGNNSMKFNDLNLDCSGATKIDMNMTANKLDADFSGASTLTLEGNVQTLDLDISGASKVEASSFIAKNCYLDCSGASTVTIHVTDKLRAEGSGVSKISYKGNPAVVETNMSGASKVNKI